ncbi:hypothetical protein NSK_006625 [Nannochloropsis salina CCMP1776]|uniref:Acyltransferase 3 domain-containing protein n=1 Tax=Nannochloropsis salina CCMP1776 TaxID=1027361 RepID=A0A4D9CV31_9STRA|nr:hypothetical protein NSK_006625 [Nannochloropsis salina CCMP1776]|eukprot:TFJ81957.1 hypothetical protein NSK_006625 [Nannochloropsis salina CCMP1776]
MFKNGRPIFRKKGSSSSKMDESASETISKSSAAATVNNVPETTTTSSSNPVASSLAPVKDKLSTTTNPPAGKNVADSSDSTKHRPTKKMESLQALRYITALQMVYFHYFQNTPWPLFNRASAWGNSPFTFILMLSGFVMSYVYGRNDKKIDVTEFLIKRWANLYPLYLVTVIAGFLLIPSQVPQPLAMLFILLAGASGFIPSAFINDINTPGWTIGALFILYSIFPFSVRMLKACSRRTRIFVCMPIFFACSIAKPVSDLSVNLGILSGLVRLAALSSIPDFLQGINLGILFLEHDWTKHPLVLQKFGMSACLLALCCIFVFVDLFDLPVFFQLWRAYGMLQPLWMAVIWYAAHGKDYLSLIFELPFISYLGNTSFGVYILQQLLIDYKWKNDPFLLMNNHPQLLSFSLILTALGALGYHCIQLPYQPYISREGNALLKKFRASRWGTASKSLLFLIADTWIGRGLTWIAFYVGYLIYTNYQPCLPVDFDQKLVNTRWFTRNDWNWLINWYMTPCTPRRLIPIGISDIIEYAAMGLAALGLLGYVLSYLGNASKVFSQPGQRPTRNVDLSDVESAVVLRVVCRSYTPADEITATLNRLIDVASELKTQYPSKTIALEVVGAAGTYDYTLPASLPPSSLDVTLLNMPFEAARSRSQTQPQDVIISLPVGARLGSASAILRILSHASSKAVVAFSLGVDGSDEVLPSLGTLAELNFQAPLSRRPCLLVGTAALHRKLSSYATFAALEHGTPGSDLLILAPAPSSSLPLSLGTFHSTPSLTAHLARRRAFLKRATVDWTSTEMAVEAFRLLCESAFHLGFVLAFAVVIGTPVHIVYAPGNYCNFYWSNQCTNGVAEGMYLSRVIMTCICAIYTTGFFARFLFAFRLTEGGLVRSIILTFLLLFLLPVTAFVEAGHCLWAAFAMFNPGAIGVEKRSTTPSSVAKQNSMETSLFSPSAHA